MATQGQSSKGQWIGISTAEETGELVKRLVGQPWREFVKGESEFVKGIDTETGHSKQSFGRLYRAIFKGDVRAQSASHHRTLKRVTVQHDGSEDHTEYIKFTEGGVMAAQTRLASIHEEIHVVEWVSTRAQTCQYPTRVTACTTYGGPTVTMYQASAPKPSKGSASEKG